MTLSGVVVVDAVEVAPVALEDPGVLGVLGLAAGTSF